MIFLWISIGLVGCLGMSPGLAYGWCQGSLENPFDEVLMQYNISGETLSLADLRRLTSTILQRVGCNTPSQGTHVSCTNCLTAEKIFHILKIPVSRGLSRNQFQQASTIILDIISNLTFRCQDSGDIFKKWTYADFEARFLSGKSHYSLQQLEKFMEQLSKVYFPPASAEGRPCWHHGNEHSFTAKDIYEHVYGLYTVASSEELGKLHSHLLLRLLKGECIRKNNLAAGLPSPNEFDRALFRMYGDSATCRIPKQGFEQLMNMLKIGGDSDTEIPGSDVSNRCYKQGHFSDIFGLDMSRGLSQEDFHKVCPALLEQAVIGNCPVAQGAESFQLDDVPEDTLYADVDPLPSKSKKTKLTMGQKFGWGTLFVAIISLSAVVGALFLKFQDKPYYHFILVTMLGLATGCMIGDAFLHLIPEALGAHSHSHDDHEHDTNKTNSTDDDHDHEEEEAKHMLVVFRMFATCMSLYLFFLVQLIMEYFITIKPKQEEEAITAVTFTSISEKDGRQNPAFEMGEPHQEKVVIGNAQMQAMPGAGPAHGGAGHSHSHGHGHAVLAQQGHVAPVALAWMVTIGDAMHNFADGLAIGAALNTGLASGISTSIAIFCHEVPQELGDIAAMISAGWSVKRALFFNFLSALTCFIGLYIGIPAGENKDTRMWLFAVAAGTFVYISLADIVPEILEYYREYHPWKVFGLVNAGMMFGFLLMLVIGLFESKIRVSL